METVTYTKIWFGDFDKLCIQHCGAPEDYSIQQEQFNGQDTYILLEQGDFDCTLEELEEAYGKPGTDDCTCPSMVYAWKLFALGILPRDYPVFVDIWW